MPNAVWRSVWGAYYGAACLIGGYGRSGSTLLEALLTTSSDVVGCGETVGALRDWNEDRRCTCHRNPWDCQVWGALLASTDPREEWSHADLDSALLNIVSSRWGIMVDSSKTAWREARSPFRLRAKFRNDFQLVHLVRDPRAVCWSILKAELKRAQRKGARARILRPCFVSATGWLVANLACELFGWLYPEQYLRLRYEDLAQAPREVLRELLQRLLPERVIDLSREDDGDNRHQLFGNRLRRRSISLAEVRVDDAWREHLPKSCYNPIIRQGS